MYHVTIQAALALQAVARVAVVLCLGHRPAAVAPLQVGAFAMCACLRYLDIPIP